MRLDAPPLFGYGTPKTVAHTNNPGGDTTRARQTPRVVTASTFSGKWQATWCPGVRSTSGGTSVRHTSWAFQHRVENRQPGGGLTGEGTSPVSRIWSRSVRRLVSGIGTADSSAIVYGCIGRS